MKYRRDFVTNSSSSSFICEICGEEASGWDMSLEDAGMVECENGHVFCEHHLSKKTARIPPPARLKPRRWGMNYLIFYKKASIF